ncbi:MAG: isoleucine--tRNA ligase [Gemmatimonadota bacterium]|nr:isoleucine--tRNA ligase [Gemmatimonadota bacterium]
MTTVPETTRFAMLAADRSADDLEREVLARWTADDLFGRTLAAAAGRPSYVFFEGPPTANGKPGIHHVFSRTIKDLFCRHRAMKGFRVERKAGWDTHGLPVEIEIEKKLGISGKQQIEALGVAEFNRLSRESVFTYRADWEQLSERIGYWLDYAHPYVTYHHEYVESVWWALKTLHGKGYLYRGHKILPYCPRCGTALSSHEVAQGYEDVDDPSVYVALDLAVDEAAAGPGGRRILVWTTTPWTLVSNTALAVHPDLGYVELVRKDGDDKRTLILAESRVRAVLGDDFARRWDLVRLLRGAELVGRRYRRPFDWLPYPPGAHEIIVGEEFVSAEDGSGVVHLAPAFGADDYAAGQRHGLAFLQPVNARGEFPADLPVGGGMSVKAADAPLIDELKRRGVLWKAGKITHAYPHCWRCGTPLLYYARTSWFVKTTAYRDRMLARNARVDWHPAEVGEGRFGEWLKNNIDWAISRDRYWGTPLPVWVCDADDTHVDVIGGFAELAARAAAPLGADFDPHKPHVDGYAWACTAPGCRGTMRRVSEVIDTWFDSGSMPFAQWGYPHAPGSRERLEAQYPADFIAEGVDQTRGWFYSLLAIATGLGDALPRNGDGDGAGQAAPAGPAPYGHVVVNDLVLDADGQKMSKSRGNVVDPWSVIARYGADAVRLFLVASADVSVPRKFDERAIREQAVRVLLTLRHVYGGMFAQYANFGWAPSAADPAEGDRPPMDRWMLSRLAAVEADVDAALERYDATTAARALIRFVDDDVANWYVRLSRSRFYEVDAADNRAAFATLHEVLVTTARLLAPITPFLSDWMHHALTGEPVHLAPYVRPERGARDPALERAMAAVRTLATLGRAAREAAGVKVRQPLGRMVCVAPDVPERDLAPLVDLLATELNVKRVDFASTGDALVTLEAKPNFRSLGKKFGKQTPLAAQAIQALPSAVLLKFLHGEPLAVDAGGETHELDAEDVTIVRRASGDLVVEEAGGFFAALDPAVTPALRREGLARELVSRVQRVRKDTGLAVSDRIVLYVGGDAGLREAVGAHGEWIGGEVLATRVVWTDDGAAQEPATMQAADLDGTAARIAITKAE